jgi:hypothetical protein
MFFFRAPLVFHALKDFWLRIREGLANRPAHPIRNFAPGGWLTLSMIVAGEGSGRSYSIALDNLSVNVPIRGISQLQQVSKF